jgi:hypothetical protein
LREDFKASDYDLLNQFTGHILDQYKLGATEREEAIGNFSHLVLAISRGGPDASDPILFMRGIIAGDA